MKKSIVTCCLMAITIGAFAGIDIPLYPKVGIPFKTGAGPHRIPQRPLVVELDNYTLSFGYGFDEVVTVELLDADEDVVYTDWLAPGQTSLVFPSTLSGEYTIGLTVDSVYYIGVIEL